MPGIKRPFKITITVYNDDGMKSWQYSRHSMTFSKEITARERLIIEIDKLLERYRNSDFGVKIEMNFGLKREVIINDRWYL